MRAFAESELARMADDLAIGLHHVASAAADAGASHTQSVEEAGKSGSAQPPVAGAPAEAAGSLSASEDLQEQLAMLRAECIEAQQLKDHWHSEYTAQVNPCSRLPSIVSAEHVHKHIEFFPWHGVSSARCST